MTNEDVGSLTRRRFLELPVKATAGAVLAGALGLPLEARAADSRAMGYFQKGFQLAEQGKYEEAFEMYKAGHQIDSSIVRVPKFKKAEAERLYVAGYAIRKTDPERAIELYKQSMELEPDSPLSYNQIGRALAEQAKYDEAFSYFKRGLSVKSNDPLIIGNLGDYMTKIGKHNEAYFWNRVHILLDPNSPAKRVVEANLQLNMRELGKN